MYKRLIGLMMALVLMFGSVPVSAGGSLTVQEIVDQVIVPMARENDNGENGYTRYFSYEELAEIVRVLEENGITLPENSYIMQCVTSGCGYPETSVVDEVCVQVFGKYGTWTDEQVGWYDDKEVRLGHAETYASHVPGKDNMTREEAIAWALKKIREEYGKDLPLEDPEIWQLTVVFMKDAPYQSDSHHEDQWSVSLDPKDTEHASYSACFTDNDPEGTTELYYSSLDQDENLNVYRMQSFFIMVYGSFNEWPQSAWQAYSDTLQKVKLRPSDYDYFDYAGYQLCSYPEPESNEISREEAVRIAKGAMTNEKAAYNSAVLTEYKGERTWLVSFVVEIPIYPSAEEAEAYGYYAVTIDSVSGEVLSLRNERSYTPAFCYVAEKAYNEIRDKLPKEEDLLPLAAEAVRKEYPEAGDPLDEENYRYSSALRGDAFIKFTARNIQRSDIKVRFTSEGKVKDVVMDPPVDGDSLFSRFYTVYGPMDTWDQSVWVQLEKDMKELEPTTIEGKVLKATHYPDESSMSIKQEEARKLGRKTTGKNMTEVNSCVLVDAEPHPVWIVQLLTEYTLSIVGIDAETGEAVLSLPYRADFSSRYMIYSLPETWRKIEIKENGPAYLAQAAIIDRVFPADVDWRAYDLSDVDVTWTDYCYMNEDTAWRMEVDGLTVRCISRREGVKSYEVEFDQEGNVIRYEEKD